MIRAARLLLFLLVVLSGATAGSAWACGDVPTSQPISYGLELGDSDKGIAGDRQTADRGGKPDESKNCSGCCGIACTPSAMSHEPAGWKPAGAIMRLSDVGAEAWDGRLVLPPLPPPRFTV